MDKDQIVYFYYNNVIPCQKGKIKEVIDGGYEVYWLNDNDKSIAESSIRKNMVFQTEEECIAFHRLIENNKTAKLRDELSSRESVLRFMYNAIYNDGYDWSTEKKVLREKIKEMFGVNIIY